MSNILLSERLLTIAEFVKEGWRVADIGSDHAYLPCYLVKNKIAQFAIAGEVVDGPYNSALKKVTEHGLTEQISVRKGDGLAVIRPDEVDCVTVAGMGASLIVKILNDGRDKLGKVSRLILQPNVNAHLVREWLYENGWQLVAERIVEENDKIYEVLVADKGDPAIAYDDNLKLQLLFGPFLLKEKAAPFIKKWQAELRKHENVLSQLEQAKVVDGELEIKAKEMAKKVELIEEVLQK